jgi:hypothetical protein
MRFREMMTLSRHYTRTPVAYLSRLRPARGLCIDIDVIPYKVRKSEALPMHRNLSNHMGALSTRLMVLCPLIAVLPIVAQAQTAMTVTTGRKPPSSSTRRL